MKERKSRIRVFFSVKIILWRKSLLVCEWTCLIISSPTDDYLSTMHVIYFSQTIPYYYGIHTHSFHQGNPDISFFSINPYSERIKKLFEHPRGGFFKFFVGTENIREVFWKFCSKIFSKLKKFYQNGILTPLALCTHL